MTPTLFHDLSTDRNMGWVRSEGWLTYLSLDAPAEQVTYDMGISPNGVIRLAPFGTPPMAIVDKQQQKQGLSTVVQMPLGTPQFVFSVVLLLGVCGVIVFWFVRARVHLRKS